MKKLVSLILSVSMLCSFMFTACSAENDGEAAGTEIVLQIGNPIMTVNGVRKEIDPGMGTAPIILKGRTLLPVRAVIEELGGTVGWNGDTQEVTLHYGSSEIRLTIDSATAYFDGAENTLEVAPTLINGRTMLPIRFVAERFQFHVDWNGDNQTIIITKNSNDSDNPSSVPSDGSSEHTHKAVTIYFSATGNTKLLAEKIAGAANTELFEIVPSVPYTSEDLNYHNDSCRANTETSTDARPAIDPVGVDIAQYNVILLGYPIWWGQCPPAMRTFLDSNDLTGKTIMPFCTSGSSSISGSLSKIRELCPNSTVTDGFRGTGSTTEMQINEWLAENGFAYEATNISNKSDDNMLYIQVGETTLTAELTENSSAAALRELLKKGPLTVHMSDYGHFEKVGNLGTALPRNDEPITTEPGDLILYQGNSFVIYYDTNSWNFTRIGKINNVTREELKALLGTGDVTVTLSIQ